MKPTPTADHAKATPQCWLWPNHTIGKVESRLLRAEHNELVNSHDQLKAQNQALREALAKLASAAARVIEDDNQPKLEHFTALNRARSNAALLISEQQ